jgi:hypothetical protein
MRFADVRSVMRAHSRGPAVHLHHGDGLVEARIKRLPGTAHPAGEFGGPLYRIQV